jgi:hypothetical protein
MEKVFLINPDYPSYKKFKGDMKVTTVTVEHKDKL